MIVERLRPYVGADAATAWRALVEATETVTAVWVVEYSPPPPLQERSGLAEKDPSFLDRALELRSRLEIPFWDALFVVGLARQSVPGELLDGATFHQSIYEGKRPIGREDVLRGALAAEATNASRGRCLAICSAVQLADGAEQHFPMIDFHCRCSDGNLEVVQRMTARLFPDGALVFSSGNSYHSCGTRPVSAATLVSILGKALLFGPFTDRAYLAHQLIEGQCSLRISRGGREDAVPQLISVS